MTINYKFGEGPVAEREKEYINERMEKIIRLMPNYSDQDEIICDVEAYQDKKSFWNLEVSLQTPHNLYRAEETNHTLTHACDKVEEILKRQISRGKQRAKDLRERGRRSLKKKISIDEKARF